MAYEGQELAGPNGMRLRFVRITDDVLEMEAQYSGEGPLPPAHMHPRQDEEFTVIEGAVRAVIGAEECRFAASATFQVPAGTPHQLGGDGPARMQWLVRPAMRTAEFFEGLYTGAAASDPGGFLERYANEFRLVPAADPGEPAG